MPWRDSPQWIDDRLKDYQRARKVRLWGRLLGWIAATALVVGLPSLPGTNLWTELGTSLLLGWWLTFFPITRRNWRVRRYDAAITIVQDAILGYRKHLEQPDSMLADASERASQTIAQRRLRSAPRWTRNRRLVWRLAESLCFTLQLLAYFYLFSPDHRTLVLFAGILLSNFILGVPMDRLQEAQQILTDAAEEYENSSPASEDALRSAGARASAVLALRQIWRDRNPGSPTTDPTPNA